MKPPGLILVSPVGDIAEDISGAVADKVAKVFNTEVRITPLLPDIAFAYDVDRHQYWSTRVLDELEKTAPDHCLKVVAITKNDLFIPILTHVYGEAQLGGKAAVVSIFRLNTGLDAAGTAGFTDRIVKEAIHELGHTFDLRHCDDPLCIMHYCRKIADVDRKLNRFCRYCSIFLSDSIKALEK
ncbi:MAG: archaemetzincin family Zn-dependent metalloprotease [Desulfotignum sp.]|nr:archaemetzincin family Zn-dependent metalloprotease [Desulfotignum sp.]MCF8125112.1 archaemetzincin family Zn-dependent metalloprotease [Desulfotignum sp.]